MNVLQANLRIIGSRFPEMEKRVRSALSAPASSRPRRSVEDADLLAQRWLRGRRIREGALLAISGFGDGAHVRAALDVLPEGALLFVGEASVSAFRAELERVDLGVVLADERLLLGIGPADNAFFESLTFDHAMAISDVEPWIFAPCFNLDPEYYRRFFLEFARFVDFRRKLEGTRIVDAALWQGNSFANLEVLADAPEITALGDLFRGRPMVLVSAGPSLDESLEFLRAASRVAVIVAVNSSYRAVRNAGIVPHLVLAADPREFTSRGFAGVNVDGTWLVTTPIVHPDVVRLFRGRAFIWSGANELFLELRRRLKMSPGIRIVEQGTVSACGVDLGIIMGCDRICLVGQDLAIRDDGRSHASDSFYSDMNANRADTERCRRLPGNTRPEVLVEEKLYIYLKTFEQLAANRPQAKFCNTSRLGARIEGIPYMAFDQALTWLGGKSTGGAMDALAKRHRTGASYSLGSERVRAVLAPVEAFARDILRLALKAAALLERLPEASLRSGDDSRSNESISEIVTAVADLRARAASDPGDYAILEGGRARLELFTARLFGVNLPRNLGAQGRRLLTDREYAWAMAEGAWFLLNQLDRILRADDQPAEGSAKNT